MDRLEPDLLNKTNIANIMNKKVVTIHEDDDFSQAFIKFSADHVAHIVVLNSDEQVVGLISQKYLYKTKSPRKVVDKEMEFRPDLLRDGEDAFYTKEMLDSYILSNVMQKHPLVLHPQDSVSEAVLQMANKKLSCIPIVDAGNKITGVLTHMEIIAFISRFC